MKKLFFYGFMVLGFIAGYFLGNIFYNLVLIGWVKSTGLFFASTFLFAFIGAFLCYKKRDNLAILTTAFLGAYSLIRGISVFAGGFPNEITLYQ